MERRSRSFRVAAVATPVALAALAVALGRPLLERAARIRIEREAARHGLAAEVEGVRVGLWPALAIGSLRARRGAWAVAVETVSVTPVASEPGLRVELGQVALSGPASLSVEAGPTAWYVSRLSGGGVQVELREPVKGLTVAWLPAADGERVEAGAAELPAGRLLAVRRAGEPVLDAGFATGSFHLSREHGTTCFDLALESRDARAPRLSDAPSTSEGAQPGQPAGVALQLGGAFHPAQGRLDVPRWRLSVDGATLSGSLAATGVPRDPAVDLSIDAEHVDFERLLRTSGLAQLQAAALGGMGAVGRGDLGSASLSARFRGRLADATSFSVSQRLDFTPPRRIPSAVERLRGPFVHEISLPGEPLRTVEVSPASADFIALPEVPALFIRALLLGEDASFLSHRGVDLSELPAAILTDWARGGPARGASTITQQLAKNLFLSREKRLGRKLQELPIALLLEAALGKERILEIYLNVIEWGPGLHGLRPAARRYFGEEPRDLTPAQMAFLVSLIPAPVKYQRSFAAGGVSRGLRDLVDGVLTKLRSVGALSDEEYRAALAEELVVAPPPAAVMEPAPPG